MAFTVQVTFDSSDPRRLAEFWCAALGYELDSPPEGFDTWEDALRAWQVPPDKWNSSCACHDPSQVGPRLFFQQVPEAKSAKNRVHLDVRAAPGLKDDERMRALRQRAADLEALGAQVVREQPVDALSAGFIVMHDPEGNEFCLD